MTIEMIALTLTLIRRGGLMRAADLDIHELLHFPPEGGIITFAGERVLLLDAVALGLLRRELIETLGMTAARVGAHAGSGMRTDGGSPKCCARDSRGTAKTNGEWPARGFTRFRVSCARR